MSLAAVSSPIISLMTLSPTSRRSDVTVVPSTLAQVGVLARHQYSSWRRSSSISDSAESSSGSASARFLLRLRGSVSAPISPTPSGSRLDSVKLGKPCKPRWGVAPSSSATSSDGSADSRCFLRKKPMPNRTVGALAVRGYFRCGRVNLGGDVGWGKLRS